MERVEAERFKAAIKRILRAYFKSFEYSPLIFLSGKGFVILILRGVHFIYLFISLILQIWGFNIINSYFLQYFSLH